MIREVEIAVNLMDLERIDPIMRRILLHGKVDLDNGNLLTVVTDRKAEVAIRFTCDTLTAACVCEALRNRDRVSNRGKESKEGKGEGEDNGTAIRVTRVYLKAHTVWTRITSDAQLIEVTKSTSDSVGVIKGKLSLNPLLFPPSPISVEEMRKEIPQSPVKWDQ